jgi:hypothetical protein
LNLFGIAAVVEFSESKTSEILEVDCIFYIFLMFGMVLEEKNRFGIKEIMKECFDADSCVVVADCPDSKDNL